MNRVPEPMAEPVATRRFERATPGWLPPGSAVEPTALRPERGGMAEFSPPATEDREETRAALRQQAEGLRGRMEQIERQMRQLEPDGNGKAVARVDAEECAGCGTCVDACPRGAIELLEGVAAVDTKVCQGCGACVEACPNEAIALAG